MAPDRSLDKEKVDELENLVVHVRNTLRRGMRRTIRVDH